MKSTYIVLCASRAGDYTNEVCDILNKEPLFINGSKFAEKIRDSEGVYSTDDDTIITIKKNNNRTTVIFNREIAEPIEESERIIDALRKELSSKLKEKSLTLH